MANLLSTLVLAYPGIGKVSALAPTNAVPCSGCSNLTCRDKNVCDQDCDRAGI